MMGKNEVGELCVRGPHVMKGYYGNAKATSETVDKEGWLHTGDVGYYDDDGDCFIVDRAKELIKYKGFQVRNERGYWWVTIRSGEYIKFG